MQILRPDHPQGPFRAAVLDFDGTLSLLRRGWQEIMIPMAMEFLAETGTSETDVELRAVVEDFVGRLTGKQTIYQMIQLAAEVTERGGVAREPLEYKKIYHDRLWRDVSQRIDSIRKGETPPEELTVPGSYALLDALTASGIACYLASGTDEKYVLDEAALLGLDKAFEGRIYGAQDDYKKFSKAMIIERIIRETGVAGDQILGFGDGYVEIEEVKKVGGLAIGVASDEFARQGIDAWKRERLVKAGADIIVGDYRDLDQICDRIGLVPA